MHRADANLRHARRTPRLVSRPRRRTRVEAGDHDGARRDASDGPRDLRRAPARADHLGRVDLADGRFAPRRMRRCARSRSSRIPRCWGCWPTPRPRKANMPGGDGDARRDLCVERIANAQRVNDRLIAVWEADHRIRTAMRTRSRCANCACATTSTRRTRWPGRRLGRVTGRRRAPRLAARCATTPRTHGCTTMPASSPLTTATPSRLAVLFAARCSWIRSSRAPQAARDAGGAGTPRATGQHPKGTIPQAASASSPSAPAPTRLHVAFERAVAAGEFVERDQLGVEPRVAKRPLPAPWQWWPRCGSAGRGGFANCVQLGDRPADKPARRPYAAIVSDGDPSLARCGAASCPAVASRALDPAARRSAYSCPGIVRAGRGVPARKWPLLTAGRFWATYFAHRRRRAAITPAQ